MRTWCRRGGWRPVALAAWVGACGGQEVNLGKAPARATAAPQPPQTRPTDAGVSPPSPSPDATTTDLPDASPPPQPTRDAEPVAPAASEAAVPEEPGLLFDEPRLVAVINSDFKDDNPTLTGDMLEIYFSSRREDDADVWFASRSSVTDEFSEPQRVDVVSTEQFDSSPAVESGGLVLWVGSRRSEEQLGVDIFQSTRAALGDPWGEPVPVLELNSTADDIPRPTGQRGMVMPLASRRDQQMYQTYLAERATPSDPFGQPVLLAGLTRADSNTVDAFLTDDGLTLLYVHAQDGIGDLYVSERQSAADAFVDEQPLTSLNTAADERDPWLSPDGSMLYFASDREGVLNIYVARRTE